MIQTADTISGNHYLNRGFSIKSAVKKLVMLLLLGQIFLVGAVIQTDTSVYHDAEDWNESEEFDLEMKRPARISEDRLVELLSEDEMPVPEEEKEAPEVKNVNFSTENSFEILEMELNQKVRIIKRNQGNKILRVRIIPAISELTTAQQKQIKKRFNRFSFHNSSRYSELLFAAGGRIGVPYISTNADEGCRLSIPFQADSVRFVLPVGEKVADGVTYYRDRARVNDGATDVHVLRIEPFAPSIKVLPVLANEGIAQKETLSSMSRRYNTLAAINGAYFTSRGDPIGTLIINRRLISSPLYRRSVFGVTDHDTLIFGNPDFSGQLRTVGIDLKIDAVNQPRKNDQIVIYTPEYARSTLTGPDGLELVLVKGKVVGIHKHDALIPPDGVVISASGQKAAELSGVRLGQTIELDYSIEKPWDMIKHAVCGGPRLVENGKMSINGKEEKFSNSIINGRHPRTAVALTFEGDLLLVVVDGRSKRNKGMKLSELATYLRTLGTRHAINLDGGGSSSMLIKGKTVNAPSDGRERRISNGILITKN